MLKQLIRRLFKTEAQPVAALKPEAKPIVADDRLRPNPGTTILIVDDSKTVQIVLAKKLQKQGYLTLSAFNGTSGVELAKKHKPALVLMDVVMPGISGFHATRDIRRDPDPKVSSIPVIIMSGNKAATEEFWSLRIGANDFMAKPFSDEELFGRIEKQLFPSTHDFAKVS